MENERLLAKIEELMKQMTSAGATVVNGEGLICHETPDEDGLSECVELGKALAQNA